MKLTVQDMNAMVKYMEYNEVRNVELVNDGLSWETSSDIITIVEAGDKYTIVKRPLNPPVTDLGVIDPMDSVDVEEGLESLLNTLKGEVLELYTCNSGVSLARDGDSFYAWDKERAEEEGAKYAVSVPASWVDYISNGEYLVGEKMSVSQIHSLVDGLDVAPSPTEPMETIL